MHHDPDDCIYADGEEACEHQIPDESVDIGDVAEDVCPPGCPHYRPYRLCTVNPSFT